MTCWSVLQLDDDADERSIKRSYARLLRVHRPDDDPEGFQRLREAYEHALSVARWQAELERDLEDQKVEVVGRIDDLQWTSAERQHEPLDDTTAVAERVHPVEPAPFKAPQVSPAELTARGLLDGLSAENLPQRWEQAQAQDCAEAFERLLLQLCFDHPSLLVSIAGWAAQQLEWLTPWQNLVMSDWQQEMLASSLLRDYRQTLHGFLAAKQEREFINQLKDYSDQPWLKVFDQRQQWQQIILDVLHDTEWSLPLFDRVSQLFGWDDNKGIHPQPEATWQALIERCNQEAFYQNLVTKAESDRLFAADVQAAHLLMNPMWPEQQKRMIDGFGINEWQACQDLAQTLKWRYPELQSRTPYADVFFWRRFLPRPIAAETWIRVWAGIALALWLFYVPINQYSVGFSIALPMLMACVPVWFGRFALSWWVLISAHFIVQDLWFTERIIPKRWNPNTHWLLLRHGLPQAALLLVFGLLLGWLGVGTYIGVILLGLYHKRRIGRLDQDFRARHPWLTALHWAHFSPLQVLFLLVMVGVFLACQIHYPGFPLTRLLPSPG